MEQMLYHHVGLTSWSGAGKPLRVVLLRSGPRLDHECLLPMPLMGSIASTWWQMHVLHVLSFNLGLGEGRNEWEQGPAKVGRALSGGACQSQRTGALDRS